MSRRNPASQVVDVSAQVADLDSFWFLSTGGATTITGIYVNAYGNQVGNSFSLTVNAAGGSPVGFSIPAGSGGPGDVCGAVCRVAASVSMCLTPGSAPADFAANQSNYPRIPASDRYPFGRVNVN